MRHAFGYDDGDGTRIVERHVLREAADAQRRLMPDRAVLGRELTADDPEQRRLAGAIAADDADTLARFHLQARVGKKGKMAVRHRYAIQAKQRHARGSPR